jgi:hypothetical protein
MFVKPGLRRDDPSQQFLVRKPNRQFLSPGGEDVPDNDLYWHKLVLEGDVVAAEPAAVTAEPVEVKGSAA